jgi:hypothetical protein
MSSSWNAVNRIVGTHDTTHPPFFHTGTKGWKVRVCHVSVVYNSIEMIPSFLNAMSNKVFAAG